MDLTASMRNEAQRVLDEVADSRIGLVTSYDPESYAIKVKIQPDGVETGWMAVASIAVGNGWGLYFPPEIGDQAVITFQEGDINSGICHGFLYNDEDKPLKVGSGEWWLVHKSKTHIKFLKNGDLDIRGPNIMAGPLATAVYTLVDQRFQELFNSHRHPTPNGMSGPPVEKMTQEHLTKSLKGG